MIVVNFIVMHLRVCLLNDTVTPNVNISEQFGTNNITITLEWDHKNGVFYTVSVDPQVTVNYTGKSNAQIVVSYNTKYNISVVTSLCGRNSTTFNIFNHGKLDIHIKLSCELIIISAYTQ